MPLKTQVFLRIPKGGIISNEAYDKESSYTSKRGQRYHGLKMHIATDSNGVIKDVIATTASTHDSTQFEALSKGEKRAVFADSGYMSQKRKRDLRTKGIFGGIIERRLPLKTQVFLRIPRVRGQSKLRTKQSKNNKRFAKIRSLVELPFAFIKQHMNFRASRYLGIAKNQEHFYLLATCYNLRRIPFSLKKALNHSK